MKSISILARVRKKLQISSTVAVALGKAEILVWANAPETQKNLGDALNPLLFRTVSGKHPIHSGYVINLFRSREFFLMGSILDGLNKKNAIILGAGFISAAGRIRRRPKEVIAVRGELTREKLRQQGVLASPVLCDPGLLLSRVYPEVSPKKEVRLGIIPHYVDKGDPVLLKFLEDNPEVLLIDIEGPPEFFVQQLSKCQYIASSSLHGIIFAHSYGIPAVWLKISSRLNGGDFKFLDYFSAFGLKSAHSASLLFSDVEELVEQCSIPQVEPNIRAYLESVKSYFGRQPFDSGEGNGPAV